MTAGIVRGIFEESRDELRVRCGCQRDGARWPGANSMRHQLLNILIVITQTLRVMTSYEDGYLQLNRRHFPVRACGRSRHDLAVAGGERRARRQGVWHYRQR